MTYIPLSILSENTLLSSTITGEKLVYYAKKNNMKTLAITDKNVMYGTIPFYQQCLENDIKPIIGLEVDLIDDSLELPITVYASNLQGYSNLASLSSLVSTQDRGSVTLRNLQDINNDCIFIINPFTREGELVTQKNIDFSLINQTLDHLYLGMDMSKLIDYEMQTYRQVSEAVGMPLIAFQTVNRLIEDDNVTVDVLQAIDHKTTLEEHRASKNQFNPAHALETVLTNESIYKDAGFGDAIENTQVVAEQISLSIPMQQNLMPAFKVPAEESSVTYLKKLAVKGLHERLGNVSKDYIDRLEHELSVIEDMGFSDYFLIVWDIVDYAKKTHIQTGPGRGSAAGSLVAYSLYIIDVDPIKYDLLFERFLNRERFSPPDIDLDVPDDKREQVIAYIQSTYGSEYVAQIITFGTLGPKQAIRDTARIMGKSSEDINRLSKSIPGDAGMTLSKAYDEDNTFRQLIDSDRTNQVIFDTAKQIEGLKRNVSTHASGVVISRQPLTQIVPIQSTQSDLPITQYEMNSLEDIGLVKFDILGSKNLAILNDALDFVKKDVSDFNIENISLDDEKTLSVFETVDTNGIFQFESDGMKRFLNQLKPNNFEDIIAAISLFRPGPMKEISHFINRRNGVEKVEYVHNSLSELLKPTYGIMIYQEQVMRAAQIISGYSLGEADILRRAMGHKDHELIEKEKTRFVDGAVENGYTVKEANDVYAYIERFADYGFNKSHAVAYSLLAYQQAYIKAHYPKAFYAAILTHTSSNKLKIYGLEAKHKGIDFLGPDINKSVYSFSTEDGGIRIGLSQIKQVQRSLVTNTLKLQKSHQFPDFISYVSSLDTGDLNEKSIEALILAGAFDYSEQNRKTLIASLENILANVKTSQLSQNLFSLFKPYYVDSEDFTALEKSTYEFEYLSVAVTSHPTKDYENVRKYHNIPYVLEMNELGRHTLLVSIKEIKTYQTKKGEMMARIDISDETKEINVVAFPDVYRRYIKLIDVGTDVVLSVNSSKRNSESQVIVEKIALAKTWQDDLPKGSLFIKITNDTAKASNDALTAIHKKHSGFTPVYIFNEDTGKTYRLKQNMWVKNSNALMRDLNNFFGEDNVAFQKNE